MSDEAKRLLRAALFQHLPKKAQATLAIALIERDDHGGDGFALNAWIEGAADGLACTRQCIAAIETLMPERAELLATLRRIVNKRADEPSREPLPDAKRRAVAPAPAEAAAGGGGGGGGGSSISTVAPSSSASAVAASAPHNDGTISIIVVRITGKEHRVRVRPTDKIEKLKQRLEETTGVPIDQMRLVNGGRQLADDRTLASYGIVMSDMRIHMLMRLTGD